MKIRRYMLSIAIFGLTTLTTTSVYAEKFLFEEANSTWLGRPVATQKGVIYSNNCVTGDIVTINNGNLKMKYDYGQSSQRSLNEYSGTIAGSVNLGLFGGSGSISIHSRMEENSNTASMILRFSYDGPEKILSNHLLTSFGQDKIGQSESTINSSCGDEFIDHMQLGNDIYFVTQLVFQSKEEYDSYIATIKVRALFWSVTKTISEEFFEAASNAAYSVKVISTNDLPPQIITELGEDGEINCKANKLNDINTCKNASNNIMNYLLSDDFRDWLTNETNLGVRYVSTQEYAKVALWDIATTPTPQNPQLESLSNQLRNQLTAQYRLKNSLKVLYDSNIGDSSLYNSKLNNVQSNISQLQSAVNHCKSTFDPTLCQNEVNNAMDNLIDIEL